MNTVNEFIKFYKAIPEDKWTCGCLGYNEKHCAIGFLGGYNNDNSIFLQNLYVKYLDHSTVVYINDDVENKKGYGNSPKERIMNSLYEIKQMQDAEKEAQTIINNNILETV